MRTTYRQPRLLCWRQPASGTPLTPFLELVIETRIKRQQRFWNELHRQAMQTGSGYDPRRAKTLHRTVAVRRGS